MPGLSFPVNDRLRTWVLGLLSLGLLFACYWPALRSDFIWNDPDYVTRPELRSLAGLERIWTEPGATQQYYPLLHGAFWVQCRFFGDNPFGYHVVTLLLHAGCAWLFGLVLRRLAVPGAWLGALLFAFHPVHVQSVAWITEQKNTLSLVLYLAAALSYLRFDTDRRPRDYAVALGFFLLSLLAKTMTATLPAALLVVLWWKRGRLEGRRDVVPLAPWLLIGVGAAAFSTWVEHHFVGAQGESFAVSWLERILVAGRAWWIYVAHLTWPWNLNFIYPRWQPQPHDAVQWLFPFALAALGLALWAIRRRQRAPLAVFLLFTGSLLPVLGFVSLYGSLYSWVWDHWQYLPDLAPLALIAAGLTTGWHRIAKASLRPAGPILAAILIVGLGALGWRHTALFHSEEQLYRRTLARNPSVWMFHNNLAILLARTPGHEREVRGHYETALRLRPGYADAHFNYANFLAGQPGAAEESRRQFEAALATQPDHPEAHHGLANLLATSPERRAEALAHYEAALRARPRTAEIHNDLARLFASWPGHEAEAIAHYEEALRLKPNFAIAHNNLANLLVSLPGRTAEARSHYEQALQLDPNLTLSHNNFANLLADFPHEETAAIEHYQTALRLDPGYAPAHYNLGRLLLRLPGRQAEAMTQLQEALRLQPDSNATRISLAGLLAQQPGRENEAIALYEQVLEQQPGHAQVHHVVAVLLARQGRFEAALQHSRRAVELNPANAEARQVLAYLLGRIDR